MASRRRGSSVRVELEPLRLEHDRKCRGERPQCVGGRQRCHVNLFPALRHRRGLERASTSIPRRRARPATRFEIGTERNPRPCAPATRRGSGVGVGFRREAEEESRCPASASAGALTVHALPNDCPADDGRGWALPASSQPAKGVLARPRLETATGSTVQRAARPKRVTSAERRARACRRAGRTRRAGPGREEDPREAVESGIVARAGRGGRGRPRRRSPRPTTPKGAVSKSTAFSSSWCGAWSVAIASTVPSCEPVGRGPRRPTARAAAGSSCSCVENAGARDLLVGQRQVVRRDLARSREAPRSGLRARASERRAVERCATWSRPPASSATSRSRATAAAPAIAGWPGRPSRVETAPSCIGAPAERRRVLGSAGRPACPKSAACSKARRRSAAVGEPLPVVGDGDRARRSRISPNSASSSPFWPSRDRADRIDARGLATPRACDDEELA